MIAAVEKSVMVKASVERAFQVFTEDFNGWWPKSHHIGSSPMKKAILEGWVGGRCYSEQEDGTDCRWGSVLAWEPPHRFVMAWQITPTWKYEPDLAKASEVEVRFTPMGEGMTRVDVKHWNFERHGEGGGTMRGQVDSSGGWGTLLQLYGDRVAA
jgi:uncharacterized protein YndB with AHSA1/START domain